MTLTEFKAWFDGINEQMRKHEPDEEITVWSLHNLLDVIQERLDSVVDDKKPLSCNMSVNSEYPINLRLEDNSLSMFYKARRLDER